MDENVEALTVQHQPRHDFLELFGLEDDVELRDRVWASRLIAERAGLPNAAALRAPRGGLTPRPPLKVPRGLSRLISLAAPRFRFILPKQIYPTQTDMKQPPGKKIARTE